MQYSHKNPTYPFVLIIVHDVKIYDKKCNIGEAYMGITVCQSSMRESFYCKLASWPEIFNNGIFFKISFQSNMFVAALMKVFVRKLHCLQKISYYCWQPRSLCI